MAQGLLGETVMNDVQAFQLMYARHDRIVAREKKLAAETAPPATRFAEALPQPMEPAEATRLSSVAPRVLVPATSLPMGVTPAAAKPAPAAPAVAAVDMSEDQMSALMAAFAAPATTLAAAADAAPSKQAAPIDLSQDQASALMAAFGTPETASPLAGKNAAPPILPADQSALLLQSFGIAGHGYGVPETAETASAEAEPKEKAAEITPATTVAAAASGRFFPASPIEKVASRDAADAYLGAIKNMERNLARYGVR